MPRRADEFTNRPYTALANAILARAVFELREKYELDAAEWLVDDGLALFEAANQEPMDPDLWHSWVARGCPQNNVRIQE